MSEKRFPDLTWEELPAAIDWRKMQFGVTNGESAVAAIKRLRCATYKA